MSDRSIYSLKEAGHGEGGTEVRIGGAPGRCSGDSGPDRGGRHRDLKRDGFHGASARAIAATGGFNQALIFYHFGSVNRLLLAALDETSARRLDRYRAEVDAAATLPDLVAAAARIYREDLESGHIKVLAELMAAASASPELGPEIAARIEPWTGFARDAIDRVLAGSPLRDLIPSEDLAQAVVALYLGMELLTHLEGQRSPAEALFERASALALVLGPLLGLED